MIKTIEFGGHSATLNASVYSALVIVSKIDAMPIELADKINEAESVQVTEVAKMANKSYRIRMKHYAGFSHLLGIVSDAITDVYASES